MSCSLNYLKGVISAIIHRSTIGVTKGGLGFRALGIAGFGLKGSYTYFPMILVLCLGVGVSGGS